MEQAVLKMEISDSVSPKLTQKVEGNKFHKGAPDGKHYWLTPPALFQNLKARFGFDFDPCPCPKPEDFDGLTCDWGGSNYVNPPFGSIIHQGKKKGMTAWVRKAIAEKQKGKRVVMVYPLDKWVLMLLDAGAQVENLGDVKWHAVEDGSEGKGMGRHIAMFILEPEVIGDKRPELLEALEKAAAWINDECERRGDGDDEYESPAANMVGILRGAIARAKAA